MISHPSDRAECVPVEWGIRATLVMLIVGEGPHRIGEDARRVIAGAGPKAHALRVRSSSSLQVNSCVSRPRGLRAAKGHPNRTQAKHEASARLSLCLMYPV